MLSEWAEAEWSSVRESLCRITRDAEVSREEVYRSVEDLCVEGYSAPLYERVARLLFAAAQAKAKQLEVPDLADVAEAWHAHCRQTRALASVCLYLDRSYAKKRAVGLWEAGGLAFRRALRAEPGLEAAIVSRARDVAKRQRADVLSHESNNDDDREEEEAAEACCGMLRELGLYEEILEPLVLRDARDFYAGEGRRLATVGDAAEDAAQYADVVLRTLARADGAAFLPKSTRAALRAAVEDHLVAPHVARVFATSLEALVDAKRDDVLSDLYGLLERVAAADAAKKALKDLAVRRAAAALSKENDLAVVKELLSVHKRLASLCSQRFAPSKERDDSKKKSWGPGVLKDAFEEAVNADAAATRFAETLAAFFAHAVASSSDCARSLEGGMLLFRFSRSKDVFEAFFRRDLADRLLAQRSSSSSQHDATDGGSPTTTQKKKQEPKAGLANERAAIALLEKECGATFASKLDGMCNDLDLAKTLGAEYRRERPDAAGPELSPLVLTTGYWPSYPATGLTQPALEDAKRRFETYYAGKFQGRRLHWHTHLGRCVVRGVFHRKKTYQFDATPAQAAALCALGEDGTASLKDLARKTGLDDVAPVVASLTKARGFAGLLVRRDDDVVAANRAFSSKSVLVKLPATAGDRAPHGGVADDDRAKIFSAVSRDRQYAIDAAVVRVMKARKTLPHQQLLADVLARLKHPATPADIKLRIESLIDREYLERDDAGAAYYNYLA